MLANLLIHTVEVYRRAVVTEGPDTGDYVRDRFGQPLTINPRQHEVGGETLVHTYPCRAYKKTGGLLNNERMTDTFERYYEMFTETGVDIREDDAVRCIDANGNLVFERGKIRYVEPVYDGFGPHHVEYVVWIQDGPDGSTA